MTVVDDLRDVRVADADRDASRTWDRRMVERMRVGDDSALGAIYDRYAPLIFGIAKGLVGADVARDVTQEVFVMIWQNPSCFDATRGSLKTFLALAVRRRCYDAMRRSNRAAAREERVGRQPVSVPDTDEIVLATMSSERVRDAVAALPNDQRRAIELAYFEGLTFREVAAATGVPEGTAKSRLRLALSRLAASLRDEATLEIA